MKQITLPFKISRQYNFDNFISANNNLLIHNLKNLEKDIFQFIWIWGGSRIGKSHLLQSTCSYYKDYRAMYLPLKLYKEEGPRILEGLSKIDLLVIDDIDLVINQSSWDNMLFNLYNELESNEASLLASSSCPPISISYSLPDLRSRALGASIFHVKPLEDSLIKEVLVRQAQDRGMELTERTAQYLLNYIKRDMSDISSCLDKLDLASLTEKKKLTIPFVKSVLFDKQI